MADTSDLRKQANNKNRISAPTPNSQLPTFNSQLSTLCSERLLKIEEALGEAVPGLSKKAQNMRGTWLDRAFCGEYSTDMRFGGAGAGQIPLMPPIEDLLRRGGKRWRPLLMCVICEALGGGDNALPLVSIVELAHNASLIHDDIEDNSQQRRGKPAVHLLYGVDAAINSGAFLYLLPFMAIDSLNIAEKSRNELYKLYALNLRRLHLGQSYDIFWHNSAVSGPGAAGAMFIPSIEDYLMMCSLKTGVLSGFAAELGFIAANFNNESPDRAIRERLRTAGEKLGVGFQIIDDVKNLTGGLPGKDLGEDIAEGKMSLPVLLFLQSRDSERIALVRNSFQTAKREGVKAKEVKLLIEALTNSGAISSAKEQGGRLINEAISVFTGMASAAASPDANEAASPAFTLLQNFASVIGG